MKGAKLEKAILSYFDGTLSETENRQLQDTLKQDRAARDLYREHAALHQSFIFRYSQQSPSRTAKTRPTLAELQLQRENRRSFRLALAAAAIALIAIGIVLQLIFVSTTPTIASIQGTQGSQYSIHHTQSDKEEDGKISEGRLAPGSSVELTQGTLELTLEKGVRAIILAPASFQLIDENRLYLHRGTAWFHVEEEGHGFQVITHQLTATDLGTDFGVIAAPDKNDQVHVFTGTVEAQSSKVAGNKETLTAGQSRECDASGTLREISSSPAYFLQQLPKPTPGNLITNGSFELGNPPADRNWGEPANAALLPGWTYSPGITVARRSANGRHGFGSGDVNIHSSTQDTQLGFNVNPDGRPDPANATIRQTFPTVPGQKYTVSFEIGAIMHQPHTMELFSAIYDGADHNSATGTMLAHHVARRKPSQGHGYNPATSFTFTAVSTSATIVFTETSNNSSSADVTLDNVRVTSTQ